MCAAVDTVLLLSPTLCDLMLYHVLRAQAELHCLQRQHTSLLSEADVLERQVVNLKELLERAEGAQGGESREGLGSRVLQPLDTNAQVFDIK